MNQKEIRELIEFLIEKDIAEFELERGDVKIRVKRPQAVVAAYSAVPVTMPVAAPAVAHVPAPAVAEPPAADSEAGIDVIKSPIVGTFYEAASPGAPAFVKEGDTVAVGQVLCIVEAMKLMNEIESEAAGQIVKVLVSNGQPVEYGQPLFKIRTK
ncbi:MAG TPA: acetyl-CoA carboxylase biotin carboxyl carrier protein [Candidatus Saccharimonadales bacterium]|nr:acetyl-CoA carboxylase biotin carboxyl carrier protein [Candidatus Saccharimonadales bacterium]